ncbi:hypothetical protein PCK2_000686 [Pneumocystis canis]|nr:hypothetical protein PCK2_000686 [Pneumocystis canis]
MAEKFTKNISKTSSDHEWIKEFLETTKFPKVPEISLFERDHSQHLPNFQSTNMNTSEQLLSELPLLSYNIPEKNDNLTNYLKINDKDFKKNNRISPIVFSNTKNAYFPDQNEKKQNCLLEKKNLVNQATQTKMEEHSLDFLYEKKINYIKNKCSETYDMITLINYMQQEFSMWLKTMEKNKYVISTSGNQHDIARLKYQQTHSMRKLIRSLSHIRLHILSF